jgi:hypothetical protein
MVVGFDAADPATVLDLAGRVSSRTSSPFSTAVFAPTLPTGWILRECRVRPSLLAGPFRAWPFLWIAATPGTYEVHQFFDSETAGEQVWAALGRQGLRTAVIDVPDTDPIPDLNGWQISGWGNHEGRRLVRTAPTSLAADVIERFGRHPAEKSCDQYARRDALPELRRDLLAGISRKGDLAEFFLDREEWDLFFVVFSESHCAGHNCWHLHDRDHSRYNLSSPTARRSTRRRVPGPRRCVRPPAGSGCRMRRSSFS